MTVLHLKGWWRITVVTAIAAGLLWSAVVEAQETDAAKIVKDVKKSLGGIETFTCSFSWEHTWKITERTQRMEGRLWMKRPYLLRMEETSGRTVVIDGENVWDYQPGNRQVQIHDFESRGDQFPTPDQLFTRYAEKREAAYLGEADMDGSQCAVIELRPDKDGESHITVWIDRKLRFPVKVLETAKNGDMTAHLLHDVRLNEKFDGDVFEFRVPAGVETVDLRE